MTQPFCCDITSGTTEEQNEFKRLLEKASKEQWQFDNYYYGYDKYGSWDNWKKSDTAIKLFTRIIPLSEGISILKKMVGEEKPKEKTLTISDVMALLPSSEIIEANGIEGGLRDGELQMFWEGAEWLKKYIENKLQPKPITKN